jgi:DNA-binding NarL/FixJ family response regulator
MTGLQAAREINRAHPHVRMLILSMHDNEQYFFEALKAGASGYVLKSVAEGYSSREIANTLGISVKTVDRHRTNTLAKLGLRDRLALTRYAIRAGLIEP